jgi:hypothetical protein
MYDDLIPIDSGGISSDKDNRDAAAVLNFRKAQDAVITSKPSTPL